MKKLLSSITIGIMLITGCGGDDCENPNDNPNGPACLDDTIAAAEANPENAAMNEGSASSPTMEESMTEGTQDNVSLNGDAGENSEAGDEGTIEVSDEVTTEGSESSEEAIVEGTGYCGANPATEPGTLCASIMMPEEAAGLPEKVSFHFFAALPPMGPPTLMGLELAMPDELAPFTPGSEVPMLLENLPSTGELFLYAAIYMEGGGATTWQIVSGIDYEGAASWETPIALTGEPINITEPITLLLAE